MLLSPGVWLVACGVLGVAFLLLGAGRIGTSLTGLAALGFVLVIALPLDQWLLAPLENRFPAANGGSAEIKYDGIIVLGGALETGLTADRDRVSLNAASERLVEFAVLARRYPHARLVFTGGAMPNRPTGPPEADGARLLFASLGLPVDRIIFESQSRTTLENAVMAKDLVRPMSSERWLLITSASHMPRAMGVFRKQNWRMDADPVGYKTFRDPQGRAGRSLAERLALLDIAVHEWFGLLYYRLTNRSDDIWPAP